MAIALERVNDSATSFFARAFITYIPVTGPAMSVLTADVFGTGVFH